MASAPLDQRLYAGHVSAGALCGLESAGYESSHQLSSGRGRRGTEYALDDGPIAERELLGGLGCFLRKQRSRTPAKEWCTPRSLAGRQLFPCRQIRVYD